MILYFNQFAFLLTIKPPFYARALKQSIKLFLFTFSSLLFQLNISNAQTYFGFKAGANVNKISYNNASYKKFYDTKFKPGYTGGVVFLIQNKEKYGLYSEFLYSSKGKNVDSHANDYESNTATYQYLDVPVLFRVKFKQSKFDWFLQLGPEISYWLSGKGAFKVYEPDRDVFTVYDYKINFGEQKNTSEYMNLDESNRTQIGLAVGGGMIWKLQNANYVSLDFRASFGHTFMGGYEAGSIPNIGLVDNFEYSNNVYSVSAVYYFDILEKVKLSKNKYRKK